MAATWIWLLGWFDAMAQERRPVTMPPGHEPDDHPGGAGDSP
jgi:hypothetical protein